MRIQLSAALFLAAALTACSEPRPTTTGGKTSGTGGKTSGSGTSGGTTTGSSSTGGATTGANTTSGGVSSGSSSGGSTGGNGSMCSRPQECASGVCLGKHCCTSACKLDDPTGACVPTDCGTDGSCTYPGSTLACGGGCDAANQFTPAGTCRGDGSCSSTTQDCGLFKCKMTTGCPKACAADSDCSTGASCFLPERFCCPTIAAGATLYVDGSIGVDGNCCGTTVGSPCHTLTAAMNEIESSHATNVTIVATVNGGTGDWAGPETWPVTLHLGVTLHAPGVFFFVPDNYANGQQDVFDLKPFDTGDRLPVTIEGDSQFAALIGFDINAGSYKNTYDGVFVQGLTLKVISVWVGGSSAALAIGDSGTLEIAGFLEVGGYTNVSNTKAVPGSYGIDCSASSASTPATVVDPIVLKDALWIHGQSQEDLHAGNYCTVTLANAAIFGDPPVNGICPNPKADGSAVIVDGDPTAQVTLNSPVIQCMYSQGVQTDGFGSPVVVLNNALIDHCGCSGLSTYTGTLYSNGGGIVANHWGVLQEDGQIFLNGGGTGGVAGGNIIGCNTEAEPGECFGNGYPGVDVENDGPLAMNADNSFLDHAPPSTIKCDDPAYNNCNCSGPTACTPPSDFDGADIDIVASAGTLSMKNLGDNQLGCR